MDAYESSAERRSSVPPTGRSSAAAESEEATGFAQSLALGDMQMLADDFPSALESYERALGFLGDLPVWRRERAEARLRIADCHRKRGEYHEALAELARVRQEIDAKIDPDLSAKILGRIGTVQQSLGDYQVARANCSEAYETLRRGNDNQEIGLLELTLGAIASRLGDVERAREYFESALFTFRRIDHREGIARALNNLGLLLTPGTRWKEAQDYLERALAVSEESGNPPRVAAHCLNLGILLTKRCEWTRALQFLSRALLIFREVDDASRIAKTLLALGNLKRRLGQMKIAAAHYTQALDLARRHGYRREEVLALEFIGEMALREGRPAEARAILTEALQKAESIAPEGDLVAEVKRRLSEEALGRADAVAATRWATDAAWLSGRIDDRCEMGACFRILGEAAWESGRTEAAIALLRRSVDFLATTPEVLEETISRVRLAGVLVAATRQAGDENLAHAAFEILEPVWERITRLDLAGLAAEYTETHAQALVAGGDMEGALRLLDRSLALLESQGLAEERNRLIALRGELAENQAECVLATTEEFRILQEFTPVGAGEENGTGGVQRLLEQAAHHLRVSRAVIATGPSLPRLQVEASYGLDRPIAMLRALDPVLQSFGAGRMVWLTGNGPHEARLGLARDRWRQEGPLVALRLRPSEDLWGILAVERSANADPFGTKDLRMLSLFGSILSVAIEAHHRARVEAVDVDPVEEAHDPFTAFRSVDPTMRQTLSLLRRVADSDANILITGETGTGKGLLAQCIHRASRRAERPFIQVNCAALPEQLLESELFGHVQGAFTGAVRNKKGLIEEADGGTLLLDEVDRCTRSVQAKLLHVLDRREFRAVGDVRSKTVDVRIISATNRDLARAIGDGSFLEDLYYRLNDFQIGIPPLRDRREDIPVLARHFLGRFTREMDRHPAGITRETLRRLMDHEWRGNVRELEKCMRRLVVLCENGEWIGADLLPPEIHDGEVGRGNGGTLRDAVRRLETDLIRRTLEETSGNKSETSRRLHLSYPALLEKIRRYRLDPVASRKRSTTAS